MDCLDLRGNRLRVVQTGSLVGGLRKLELQGYPIVQEKAVVLPPLKVQPSGLIGNGVLRQDRVQHVCLDPGGEREGHHAEAHRNGQ